MAKKVRAKRSFPHAWRPILNDSLWKKAPIQWPPLSPSRSSVLVGLLCHPRDTTKKIQPILQRHDILFLVDEVISGFCRIGDMVATQTYGLKPDLITLAKALSAGYQPIGGVMVNEKIHEVPGRGQSPV